MTLSHEFNEYRIRFSGPMHQELIPRVPRIQKVSFAYGFRVITNTTLRRMAGTVPCRNPCSQLTRQEPNTAFLVLRIEFELFKHIAPKTAENFKCLLTGEKGVHKQVTGFRSK